MKEKKDLSDYKKRGKKPVYLKAEFVDDIFKPMAKEMRISLEYLTEACLQYGVKALEDGKVIVALKDGKYFLETKGEPLVAFKAQPMETSESVTEEASSDWRCQKTI